MESDKEEGLANKPQADEGGIGPDQQSEQPDDTGGGVGQGTADESFKIWVRISRKKQFEVTRSSTIGNVKAMIQDLTKVPVREQTLMHGDKELLDMVSLKQYDFLQEGCTLDLRWTGKMAITVKLLRMGDPTDPVLDDQAPDLASDDMESAPDLASDDPFNMEALWNDSWTRLKLKVNRSDNIASLKSQIEASSGAKADRLELTFNGQNLDDDERTLKDYGVENGSTIRAFVRADPAQEYPGTGKVP